MAGFFDPAECRCRPASVASEPPIRTFVFYHAHDEGSHFAAGEQPRLLTEDRRDTVRALR